MKEIMNKEKKSIDITGLVYVIGSLFIFVFSFWLGRVTR